MDTPPLTPREKIATSEWVAFDVWLRFKNAPASIDNDYHRFKLKTVNVPLLIVVLGIGAYVSFHRCNVYVHDLLPLFSEAVRANYVVYWNFQLIVWSICVFTVLVRALSAPVLKRFLPFLDWEGVFQVSLNTAAVLLGVSPAANLLLKVYTGPCPPGLTLWETQICNTSGGNDLPTDMLAGTYVAVVCIQIFCGVVSPTAVLAGHVLVVVLVNVAMHEVQYALRLFVNIGHVLMVLASYEVERSRLSRCSPWASPLPTFTPHSP